MSIEKAKRMYTAYGAVTDFKNFQGNPMPDFDALPEKIQQAWVAASEVDAPAVRAKVACNRKSDYLSGSAKQTEVVLNPVYGDSNENKTWSQWTPSGEIRLNITNPAAVEALELGKQYLVHFIPASDAPAKG